MPNHCKIRCDFEIGLHVLSTHFASNCSAITPKSKSPEIDEKPLPEKEASTYKAHRLSTHRKMNDKRKSNRMASNNNFNDAFKLVIGHGAHEIHPLSVTILQELQLVSRVFTGLNLIELLVWNGFGWGQCIFNVSLVSLRTNIYSSMSFFPFYFWKKNRHLNHIDDVILFSFSRFRFVIFGFFWLTHNIWNALFNALRAIDARKNHTQFFFALHLPAYNLTNYRINGQTSLLKSISLATTTKCIMPNTVRRIFFCEFANRKKWIQCMEKKGWV